MDDTRLSKALSYWLRHKPDVAGLTLDAGGWASSEAVRGALASRFGADQDDLLRVIATNDKQRFELSADGGKIRARQGHSIKVSGAWTQADPPDELFHGTSTSRLTAILAEGLKAMKRHHVHLSPDAETARRVGSRHGVPAVLVVEAGRLARAGEPFFLTANGVWLTDRVPPEFLRVL